MVPNFLVLLCAGYVYFTNKYRKELEKVRKENHIKGEFPFTDNWKPGRFHISPGLPELDWPLEIPDNVLGCGPILLPVAPVSVQDPELFQWLQRRPTILFNLGTLYKPPPNVVRSTALALKDVLDKHPEVQVLWKLPRHKQDKADVYDTALIPLRLVSDNRVKIQDWLKVEPLAVLQTGQVVCSVHHGGANSWFEAVRYATNHHFILSTITLVS